MIDAAALSRLVAPGCTVAFGDGVGAPLASLDTLAACARRAGGVRLFLGWMPMAVDVDVSAFADVATVMSGYGLRRFVDQREIRYLPCRLGTVPTLLADVVRPDVLIASVVRGPNGGAHFATEVSWMAAAVAAGAVVAAVERPALPGGAAGPPLPEDRVVFVGSDPAPAAAAPFGPPTDEHRAVAERVVPLIPEGARLQYAPGGIGAAVLDALHEPVAIDTGIITDSVADLDARGLVVGTPVAPYLAGRLAEDWVRGRGVLHPVEVTHHPGRLAGAPPLVAVNTGLEIDVYGQVNVELANGSAVAGIGGQPDYAAAAASSAGGLSIVAMTTNARGRSTLVEALSAPASTASHDVQVVVTQRGAADLRGLDREQRRRALERLWED